MSIDEVIEDALFDYCKARCERECATQDRIECDLRATIEMYVAEAVAREREECALIADEWATFEQRQFGKGGPAAAIRARAEKETK
jgi:hypothetical protein